MKKLTVKELVDLLNKALKQGDIREDAEVRVGVRGVVTVSIDRQLMEDRLVLKAVSNKT